MNNKKDYTELIKELDECKLKVKKLKENEERILAMLDASSDSIYLIDRDYRYLFVNNELLSRLGLTCKQVLGKTFAELHSPYDKEFIMMVDQVFKTVKSIKQEHMSKRLNKWFLRTINPVKNCNEGKITEVVVVSKDITEIKRAEDALKSAHMGTIKTLAHIIESRDNYTKGHSDRVTKYALLIAKELHLSENKMKSIETACQLHDIGKIGIPDYILRKTGKLSSEEWKKMKKHSSKGSKMLSNLDFLNGIAPMIKYHHERYDGKGYPAGLCGEEIPIEARIIAIADAFDAMTSERSYRGALSSGKIIEELVKGAGSQFFPEIVYIFLQVIKEHKLLSELPGL